MGIFSKVKGLGLPIPLVKVMAKQLLLALDFLHHECHIVHTGALPQILVGIMVELKWRWKRSQARQHPR
jgi:serine/threonine-protein kinase SRPK3